MIQQIFHSLTKYRLRLYWVLDEYERKHVRQKAIPFKCNRSHFFMFYY